MDFYKINVQQRNGAIRIVPEFIVGPTKDIMIRGHEFYAIFDEATNRWSTNVYDVVKIINAELYDTAKAMNGGNMPIDCVVNDLRYFSNGSWKMFKDYISKMEDTYVTLDSKVMYSNSEFTKEDYCSKQLNYQLAKGDHSAWDKLMKTLYDEDELRKLEWGIGSIIKGDSRDIQKFFVLYGSAGTGKSTFLKILQDMFEGYYSPFDAKALTSSNNQFTTGIFRNNPLLCIQHDGDLSRIEDNTKLNSIVSHEEIMVNEKYKTEYPIRPTAMLFLGTNSPVKITDAKSGIIRRLIDVHPTGNKVSHEEYDILMNRIKFEHGAIAEHCLKVYEELGKTYYDTYIPQDMIYKTDFFYNFIEENYSIFSQQPYTTLKQAWSMYKEYCSDSSAVTMKKYHFRENLKDYFNQYHTITRIDDKQVRNVYEGFKIEKFLFEEEVEEEPATSLPDFLNLEEVDSIFDEKYANCPAQLANTNETPTYRWSDVKTKLEDIDTTKVHYVLLPENLIVIDFDLKDSSGEKSMGLNLKEAAKWPPTYAEVSKSGKGLHLHYLYEGDTTKLSRIFDTGIEVKVFTGLSSLRRKLTRCNNYDISTISSGLPIKEKKMLNFDSALSENKLRELIKRNLKKEFHPGTKPSIDFIYYILKNQYDKGVVYDVSDMAQSVMTFASHSTHHAAYCLKMVSKMKFKSEGTAMDEIFEGEEPYVFFDVEVFPNLFLVNWKYAGKEHRVVRMINPEPLDIEALFKHKLIGFNNLRYDNHILYARWLGYTNEALYKLSQNIINKKRDCFFSAAYGISYTDVYDFASAGNKKSLKKWEVELGIHHQELGLPWDQPVPEEMWIKVAEYCDNDVISTEAVFNHLSGDWKTRLTLAKLTGMSPNTTTNNLAIKFVFGDSKPGLIYTDLATGKQYGPGEPGPYDLE